MIMMDHSQYITVYIQYLVVCVSVCSSSMYVCAEKEAQQLGAAVESESERGREGERECVCVEFPFYMR